MGATAAQGVIPVHLRTQINSVTSPLATLIKLTASEAHCSRCVTSFHNAIEGDFMDGQIIAGWYRHPKLGLIKIFERNNRAWVYQCYSDSGARALSMEKSMDAWTWALCDPAPMKESM